MFFVHFDRICKEKGTTPTAVTRKLGYSSSKVTAWKNGSIPKQEILETLATHLEVDVSEFFAEKVMVLDIGAGSTDIAIIQGNKNAAEKLGSEIMQMFIDAGKLTPGEELTDELKDYATNLIRAAVAMEKRANKG